MAKKDIKVQFLGYNVSYKVGMQCMQHAYASPNQLLLLEHADVITTTRSHGTKHLLVSPEHLSNAGIALHETDRGGDVTFHGKGQLVGYPVIQLPKMLHASFDHHVDLGAYVRKLESALIRTCVKLGLNNCFALKDHTGVWVHQSNGHPPKKLIAIGVGVSRGITKHGFAINVSTDLKRFTDCIIPCGLRDYEPTSLALELEKNKIPLPPFIEVAKVVAVEFATEFGFDIRSDSDSFFAYQSYVCGVAHG